MQFELKSDTSYLIPCTGMIDLRLRHRSRSFLPIRGEVLIQYGGRVCKDLECEKMVLVSHSIPKTTR
jgi:hypothetical protein